LSATKIYIVQMIILIVIPVLFFLGSQIVKDKKASENLKIKKTLYVTIIIGIASVLLLPPIQDYMMLLKIRIPENAIDLLVLEEFSFSILYTIIGFLLIWKEQDILKIFFDETALKDSKKFIIKTFCAITILFSLLSYLKYHTNILEPSIIRKELSVFTASSPLIFLNIFGSIILAPFGEEVIFRGIIYSEIRPISTKLAAIISSFMWALIHPFSIGGYIGIILLGIFLAYSYNRTKSLIVPIGIHSIQNASIDLGQVTKYLSLNYTGQ